VEGHLRALFQRLEPPARTGTGALRPVPAHHARLLVAVAPGCELLLLCRDRLVLPRPLRRELRDKNTGHTSKLQSTCVAYKRADGSTEMGPTLGPAFQPPCRGLQRRSAATGSPL
jgi:hypothetical protein